MTLITKYLYIFFALLFLFDASGAIGQSTRENYRRSKSVVTGQVKNSHKEIKSVSKKVEYIDKGDFYFLNTGEKKSFLREKNSYFIIYKRKTIPSLSPDALLQLFPDDIDIIEEHKLKKLTKFKIKKDKKHKDILPALYQADATISFISPALKSKDIEGELAVTPHIVVSFDKTVDRNFVIAELEKYNISFVRSLYSTDKEMEMKIDEIISDVGRIFEVTRIISGLSFVRWVEPDFVTSSKKNFIPNDTLFNNQWHLNNTGQNGGAVDADVDAPEGWDFSEGIGTVIAIYDDGVDTSHEDLNIWSNPGETGEGKESNGVDDDGNGYTDDYQGWDFSSDDNNPDPVTTSDNHGTAVAGVAGAIGNNSIGVSGSAPGAFILPVRMNSGFCSTFADAMRYAGKYSDVVNNSWSIGACQSSLNSAISDVVNGNIIGARRGSLGTPVLFASGNNASGWRKYTLSGLWAGTWTFRWTYTKDSSISQGYDTAWLDEVVWPGGSANFESDTVGNIPNGFSSSGSVPWTVVSDGVHARGASGKSAKAGTITNNQSTTLETTVSVTGSGSLTFWHWVSSEQIYDLLKLYAINSGTTYGPFLNYAPGQYGHANEVGYPASYPDTIAVGASNDGAISGEEERVYYSQFGTDLDIVAPSSGGGQGITTTDRMGVNGYTTSNYTSSFGGTSSATPLVAGLVADIIEDNPLLTAAQVRTILHEGADKIGPYAYVSGRNDYYGYGRVNLFSSLCPDNDGDGYTICDNDCDDSDQWEYPGQIWYEDVDGDFYSSGNVIVQCERLTDHYLSFELTATSGDCNDEDPGINPGVTEIPDDTIDQDCNGADTVTCIVDADQDEYGTDLGTTTLAPDGTCDTAEFESTTSNDCNDADNTIFPGAPEIVDDGIDQDCNSADTVTCIIDADQDEYGTDLGTTTLAPDGTCDTIESESITSDDCDDSDNNIYPGGPPTRIQGTPNEYYLSFQDAYTNAVSEEIIQAQDTTLTENLVLNADKTVYTEAGYDCGFTTINDRTIIKGNITISNGTFVIQDGVLELK